MCGVWIRAQKQGKKYRTYEQMRHNLVLKPDENFKIVLFHGKTVWSKLWNFFIAETR